MKKIRKFIEKNIHYIAWSLFLATTVASFWSWGSRGSDVADLYRLFPLLGLLAFSTMWGHYIVWALRVWLGIEPEETALYTRYTERFVLACLIAHPAIFIAKLMIDGLGLPPASYAAYVGSSMVGYVMIGTVALLAFLAYDAKKWVGKKAIWKYIRISSHVAMALVLVHSFKIGGSVHLMPFKVIWPVYAATYGLALMYLARRKQLA